MLDLWRDTRAGHGELTPRSIEYRALSPVYVEEPYRAIWKSSDTGAASIKLWTEDGKLAMRGTIDT